MMRNCSHPKLMPSTHAKKDTAARPRSLTSIPKTTSGASEKAPPFFPKVFMANTCSVLNKVDELAELIDKDQADIAVITESWIKPTKHIWTFWFMTLFNKKIAELNTYLKIWQVLMFPNVKTWKYSNLKKVSFKSTLGYKLTFLTY